VEPFTHWFSHFLGRTASLHQAGALTGAAELGSHFNWGMAGLSTLLALGGLALAYMLHGNGGAEPVACERFYTLSRNRLYVDEAYQAVLVRPAEGLAFLARVFDQFLDSLARLLATIPRFVASWVRPIQNGLVQFYSLAMVLGLAVFLTFVVFRITR
jgi:NADH:ubiquinone oxidoreductase subunit 5 (subunit L)/multisubunit Na+/H+ antiporter MnhA subunit